MESFAVVLTILSFLVALAIWGAIVYERDASCKPRHRIVTDGHRYRIQEAVQKLWGTMKWKYIMDGSAAYDLTPYPAEWKTLEAAQKSLAGYIEYEDQDGFAECSPQNTE